MRYRYSDCGITVLRKICTCGDYFRKNICVFTSVVYIKKDISPKYRQYCNTYVYESIIEINFRQLTLQITQSDGKKILSVT